MKKEDQHLSVMGHIDEQFVEEAAPRRRVRHGRLIAALVAACLAIALFIPTGQYLFTPFAVEEPPALSEFAESEYFPIISMLYDYSPKNPVYKNNFDRLFNKLLYSIGNLFSFGSNFGSGGDIQSAPPSSPPDSGDAGGVITPNNGKPGEYVEVTDNQVDGVIEADLIKRTDMHIYYLNRRTLYIYRIDGENTARVGEYTLPVDGSYSNYHTVNMYLSHDGSTVTLVASHYYTDYVQLINLDVSDPSDIREVDSMMISGQLVSTRSLNGKLLVVTNYTPGHSYENEASFVPQIDMGNGLACIPMDSILCPEEMSIRRYAVVCQVDQATLTYEDSAAFFSASAGSLFVSENSIYTMRSYSKEVFRQGGVSVHKKMTDIYRISFDQDGFSLHEPLTVEGKIKDRYCLDERDGILRVVTETDTTTGVYKLEVDEHDNVIGLGKPLSVANETNANLYCIDLATGEVIDEVIGFAPQDETVESVRFDGNYAYVCTAKVVTLTDPVFFFDLSDPRNITYKDTGKIEGYSSSLVDMGNGFLLGIGVGEKMDSLKIEVYREEEDRVASVCAYELQDCIYSADYHAYYINREAGLVGLGIKQYSLDYGMQQNYLLLYFDGAALHEMLKEPLAGYCDYQRGVYIDGFFYMFGANEYKVVPLSLIQ